MALEFTVSYIEDSTAIFRQYQQLAERAIVQLKEEDFYVTLDPESNSIAVIMNHLAGNMLSRWTDFLTTDGEKDFRNRDREFESPPDTYVALMNQWKHGWNCLFDALGGLTDADLSRVITIRGERHSVMQAINRQVVHYGYHCGQIVLLAKHIQSLRKTWTPLSVARGQSEEFNRKVRAGEASQR